MSADSGPASGRQRLASLHLSTSEGLFALPAEAMDLPDYVHCAQVSPP